MVLLKPTLLIFFYYGSFEFWNDWYLKLTRYFNLSKSIKFDIIIFDAPPILGISDSVILGDYIDGIIIVVSVDKVKRSLPKQAINRMKLNNAQLLGIISNEVTEKAIKKSPLSYNYNYSSKCRICCVVRITGDHSGNFIDQKPTQL